jgi:hypothetical protein
LLTFTLKAVFATLLLAVATWFGSIKGWFELPTHWIEILFFVLFITLVIFFNLRKLRQKQPEAFTQFYLFSIVLKMLGGLALIFFIVWDNPPAAMANATLFIISYLALTGIEVYSLISNR